MARQSWTVIVLPCRNEEIHLARTCFSLGFGENADSTHGNCWLVIVDNGSTDGMLAVATKIQQTSPDRVVIVEELHAGHVFARRAGIEVARHLAIDKGLDAEELIVVQADADCIYSSNYAATMAAAVLSSPKGTLAHAITRRRPGLACDFPLYAFAVEEIDQHLAGFNSLPDWDVIVDDKACAYRLSDYQQWGGYRREFVDGEELLAETSRMFICGRALGALRHDIDEATVMHTRGLEENAAELFATAGFPYPRSRAFPAEDPLSMTMFEEILADGDSTIAKRANVLRRRHLAALLLVLPAYLRYAVTGAVSSDQDVSAAVAVLPTTTVHDLVACPSTALVEVLRLVWANGSTPLDYLEHRL